MHNILNLLNFTPEFFQKKVSKVFRKYESIQSEYYADLTLNEKLVFKFSDFEPCKKENFEGIIVNIPNNNYSTLERLYGDYMQLPPEEEKFNHALETIDFGKY